PGRRGRSRRCARRPRPANRRRPGRCRRCCRSPALCGRRGRCRSWREGSGGEGLQVSKSRPCFTAYKSTMPWPRAAARVPAIPCIPRWHPVRQKPIKNLTAPRARLLAAAAALALGTLAGCSTTTGTGGAGAAEATETAMFEHARSSIHRDGDDLLTAGLGIDGLRQMVPPAFADPEAPTAVELRRRALWSNWRGIADLGPAGGYGSLYGSVAAVPGREFSAYATVPGAKHPHRVLVQLPDAFDAAKRCVVVTASSG